MKRIFLILALLVILLAGPADARMSAAVCGGGSGTAPALTCTGATLQQSEEGDYGTAYFGQSTNKYRVNQITYSGTTGTLCRIDAYVACKTLNCTLVTTASLYADNGSDEVGSLISTCSATHDSTPLTTSYEWISFTGCSGTLTNGTKYWIRLHTNATDAANYLVWRTDNACGTKKVGYSADATTWTYNATVCEDFRLYILE